MNKDIEALDKMRESLLANDLLIKAGGDIKTINATINNANSISNVINTKVRILVAAEKNKNAIKGVK